MADQYVNSLIGFGSFFRGDVEIDGLMRIDGDYMGTVRKASRVLIGNHGRADATLNAKVVVIGGAFQGAVYATERVVLLGTSVVAGIITAPNILVEPGAILGCSLSIHGEDLETSQDQTLPRTHTRKKAVDTVASNKVGSAR